MKSTAKKILLVSSLSLLFITPVYISYADDLDDVRNYVNSMRGSSSGIGIYGEIMTKIIDSDGKIKSAFYDFISMTSGGIPYLNGSNNFVNSPISTDGTDVDISGDLDVSGNIIINGNTSYHTGNDPYDTEAEIDSAVSNNGYDTTPDTIADDDTIDSSEITDNTITESDISDSFVARDSDKLDTLNSTQFLRSDIDDSMGGKLSIEGVGTTIGGSNVDNGWLVIGDSDKLGLDPNELYFDGSDGHFGTISNDDLYIRTNGSNRIKVDNNGNVGIGNTSPSEKLHVSGAGRFDGGVKVDGDVMIAGNRTFHRAKYFNNTHYGYFESKNSIGHRSFRLGYGNGSDYTDLYIDRPSKFNIYGANVGIGESNPLAELDVNGDILADTITVITLTETSDRRLKDNIIKLDSSLNKLSKINGYSYQFKESGKENIGLIAQEVEEVYPELVSTNPNGYKSLQYSNLVAPIIEAIKELSQKINDLFAKYLDQQEKIESLEDRISKLENIINKK